MLEFLIASGCMLINNVQYCPQTPTEHPQTIPSNDQQMQINEGEFNQPLHMLNTVEMDKDQRYGQVWFSFNTPYDANNCAEALLLVLENKEQRSDSICDDRVLQAFGKDFAPNSKVAENVFRMWAHHVHGVLGRDPVLPLGLDRRLGQTTGLRTQQ